MELTEMEVEDDAPHASNGAWGEWKRSFAGFAESVGSLGSLRWEMAKTVKRCDSESLQRDSNFGLGRTFQEIRPDAATCGFLYFGGHDVRAA